MAKSAISSITQSAKLNWDTNQGDLESMKSSMATLNKTIDPFAILSGTIVDFMLSYVGPIKRAWQHVFFNPDAVKATQDHWSRVLPEDLQHQQDALGATGKAISDVWQGDAHQAFDDYFSDHNASVEAMQWVCKAVGGGIELTTMVLDWLQGKVKKMITEFLTKMIEQGLIRLATWAFPPAGAAATAEFIAEWTVRIANFAKEVDDLINKVLRKLKVVARGANKLLNDAQGIKKWLGSKAYDAVRDKLKKAGEKCTAKKLGEKYGKALAGDFVKDALVGPKPKEKDSRSLLEQAKDRGLGMGEAMIAAKVKGDGSNAWRKAAGEMIEGDAGTQKQAENYGKMEKKYHELNPNG